MRIGAHRCGVSGRNRAVPRSHRTDGLTGQKLLRSGHPSAENGHGSEKFYTMVSMGAAVRLLLLHNRQAARKGVCLRFVIDFGGTAWHRSKNRTRLRLRTIRTETVNPAGKSVPAPAALIITGGPAVLSSPRRLLCPSTSNRWAVWAKWARTLPCTSATGI